MRIRINQSSGICAGDLGFIPPPRYAAYMNDDLPTRIRKIRTAMGLNQGEFAERLATTQSTVSRWERGAKPEYEYLAKIAELADTTIDRLTGMDNFASTTAEQIPVVGYVGAGAEVLPIDDYQRGDGMYFIERPDFVQGRAVAVEVRGDSLLPVAENGWQLIYTDETGITEGDVLNKLCVVHLLDGRTLVKRLMRGTQPQRYHLLSTNAPIIEDAEVLWAARVKAIIPA